MIQEDYFGLHNLSPVKCNRKKQKRVGRGESSGWGKTAGRGTKGQKSRKSGNVRFGFEGGQTPLIRRLPKRGFTNAQYKKVKTINIDKIIKKFPKNSNVNMNILKMYRAEHLANFSKIKFISGNLKIHSLILTTNYISKNLITKIEAVGGLINIIR